jgi:ubiquitin-protein ligase E3 C
LKPVSEDLYTQSLLTVGDEFFSSTATTSTPLTLDELTSFLRKLLNIAFTLHWRKHQVNVRERGGVNLKWDGVREKVTPKDKHGWYPKRKTFKSWGVQVSEK